MTTPDKPIYPTNDDTRYVGLSIREYFAAKIMAGFAADPTTGDMPSSNIPKLALYAVKWADALIEALNKGE